MKDIHAGATEEVWYWRRHFCRHHGRQVKVATGVCEWLAELIATHILSKLAEKTKSGAAVEIGGLKDTDIPSNS